MQSYQLAEWMPQSGLFTLIDKRVYCVLYTCTCTHQGVKERVNAWSTGLCTYVQYMYICAYLIKRQKIHTDKVI